MRIATWNVNSIRQRIEPLMAWLKECQPDIVCLQEIKCTDDAFPRLEFEALGYNVVTHGQKTFNGVALLSKLPFDETKSGLAGDDEDAHARFLEGVVTLKSGVLRIACLYLPNGNPPDSDKYPYKLKWMSRLFDYSKERLKAEEPLVLAGDFNVIPAAADVHNPPAWVNDALFRSTTREAFQSLLGLGLTDAVRAVTDAPGNAAELTHVFICVARKLDIPARFVAGYHLGGDHVSAHHCWAEAHVDGLGWVGFDPSFGYCPGEAHVRLATGLDYLSAHPMRGTHAAAETVSSVLHLA